MSCVRPATPGTVVVFAGTVLLILVSVSVPLLKSIWFLKADVASYEVTLGTWGYCSKSNCTKATLGYSLDLSNLFDYSGVSGVNLTQDIPNALVKGLTYVLVLHPVAAVFGAISVVLGLLAHIRGFGGTCWTTFFASLGASTALLAFVFDLALFIIAQKRINSSSVGGNAQLGAAIWMTLAGAILLMVSGCFFGCGGRMVRERSSRREASEKARPSVDPQYGADMRDSAYQQQHYGAGGLGARSPTHATPFANGNNLPKFAELRDGEAIPLTHMGDKDDDDESHDHQQSYQDSPYRRDVSGGRPPSVVIGVGQGYGRRNDGPIGATTPTSPTRYNNNASAHFPPPPRHPSSPTGFPTTVEPFQSMSAGPQSPTAGGHASSPGGFGGVANPNSAFSNYNSSQPTYANYEPQLHPSALMPTAHPDPMNRTASGAFNGPRDLHTHSTGPVQSGMYQEPQSHPQPYLDPFAEQHQPQGDMSSAGRLYEQHTGPAPSYQTHQPDYPPVIHEEQGQGYGYGYDNQHQYQRQQSGYDAPQQDGHGYDYQPQHQPRY